MRLGPQTVVWTGQSGNFGSLVASVPRAGGKVTEYTDGVWANSPHGRPDPVITADGRIAYLADLSSDMMDFVPGAVVRILEDGRRSDVPVSENAYGLVAEGNELYTGIGGTADSAGVYRIDKVAVLLARS